ncbi:MAG: Ca2+/H+ antiporter, family [Frankiaceae bacterium]|nr:Ca2+/H+ antiporter, family [Frankiaceae bacterium]
MNALVVLTTAALVLVAELPDKSMFAVLVLGTRFSRVPVMVGAATAFAVHVVIAVLGGHLLSLLPHRVTAAVVTLLFAGGAVWMFRAHPESDGDLSDEERQAEERIGRDHSAVRVAAVTFGFVFIGEWGDITQLLIANLAARYDALSVGIGGVIGLWSAVVLAVTLGAALLRRLPPKLFQRIAAFALAVFAVLSLVSFIRGR